jgi:hypothetical protein
MGETAFRIRLLGIANVGKSALLQTLSNIPDYSPTRESNDSIVITLKADEETILLEIFENAVSVPLHAIFGIYDSTLPSSFHSLIPELDSPGPNLQIYVIANKFDRESQLSSEPAYQWCQSHSAKLFRVSISTGQGVKSMISQISRDLLREYMRVQLQTCEDITRAVSEHPLSRDFLAPVNAELVPGYSDAVKNPMDISTVLKKLDQKQYISVENWQADFELMWRNCELFNGTDDPYFKPILSELRRFLKKKCKALTPRGLTKIGQSISTGIKTLNRIMDQPPKEIAPWFPLGDQYTEADMRLPFSDRDLLNLVTGVGQLSSPADQVEVAQVARYFNLPTVPKDGFEEIDVEAMPDTVRVYFRSFLRGKAATQLK